MKKLFTFLVLSLTLFALGACSDSDSNKKTVVEFEKTTDFLTTANDLQVKVVLSKAAEQAVTVPIVFEGTAVEGTDYKTSGTSISIPAGQSSGILTLTHLRASVESSEIKLTLGKVEGYHTGAKATCIIAVEQQENIIWTFKQSNYILKQGGEVNVEISLIGQGSGDKFVASSPITIPFKILETSTATEGNYKIKDDVKAFVVGKGSNKATITIIAQEYDPEAGKNINITLAPNGNEFVPGDREKTTIILSGSFDIRDKLLGDWKYSSFELTDNPNVDYWLLEMLTDPEMGGSGDDLKKLPKNNSDADILTFSVEDGQFKLTPKLTGDVKNYFKESMLSDAKYVKYGYYFLNGHSVDAMQCTLSQANKLFSSKQEKLEAANITFDLSADGNTLDVFIHDYLPTDFLEIMYNHDEFGDGSIWGEIGDNELYFHLWYKFERVQ